MGNDEIRGSTEPSQADRKKLWAWYSEVTGSAKTAAQAFLEKVEKDNMVHEQLLTNFNTKLQAALTQATGPGKVALDAKNYAAIVGDEIPSVGGPVTAHAVVAYNLLQSLSATNKAKAKALAEARLYSSWENRFKAVSSRFTGTGGFKNIVKCFKETTQTTAVSDDTDAGESSWAVYSRVSAALKAKIRKAIVDQMSLSTSAV